MSYQVLARKWRPTNFREMVGQEHVLQTLSHALDTQRLHHAYLFTGTRGVGKTTIARILAKCLNCEVGVSATPCGECDACREIAAGRFMDLIEVDAASRTRVEDTRELLDNVQYAPSKGRFKVYLIDEVHMLSTHSFNALLKTLEEPPPHVKFLLATTDPQKLPVTILSRCLQFNLKNLAPARIVAYLQHVLEAEAVPFDEPALWPLASAAAGSMRDALTLLDQAISFGQGEVREAAVISLLGTPDQRVVLELAAALQQRDAASLLGTVERLAAQNPDFRRLLEQLLSLFHRLAVAQAIPSAIDNSQGDRREVMELAGKLPAEDVQLWYQIALQTVQDMTVAVDRRMVFEMGLLRMLAFSPDVFGMGSESQSGGDVSVPDIGDTSVQSAEQSAEQRAEQPVTEAGQTAPQSAGGNGAAGPAQQPRPQVVQSPPVAETRAAGELWRTPEPVEKKKTEPRSVPVDIPDSVVPAPQAAEQPRPAVSLVELNSKNWITVAEALSLQGVAGNVLANCALENCIANELYLVLDPAQSALYRTDQDALFAQWLGDYFGQPVSVNIRVAAPDSESPAARRQRRRREKDEDARQRFSNDPGVREIMERFSAVIDASSLQYSDER